jgi:hypothetical protein
MKREAEMRGKVLPDIRMLVLNPSPFVAPGISDLIFIVVPRAEVYICHVWAVQGSALV